MSERRNEWCESPDHHEWLHAKLDRVRLDYNNLCVSIVQREAGRSRELAGIVVGEPLDTREPLHADDCIRIDMSSGATLAQDGSGIQMAATWDELSDVDQQW
jgi:hypothetical protein